MDTQVVNETKKWKILIADDLDWIHDLIKQFFKTYEYKERNLEFVDAYSGKEAKELLFQHPDIAVIILDVQMEEKDTGFKIVKYIREELNNKIIKIIMLTGALDDQMAQKHLSVTKIAGKSQTRRDKTCMNSIFQLPKILQKRYRPAILVTLKTFYEI